jgi:uncharacterized membrane protein YhaH (DUF805 family)
MNPIGLIFAFVFLCLLSKWARRKGRSGWWAALGIVPILGIIVIACLPKRPGIVAPVFFYEVRK